MQAKDRMWVPRDEQDREEFESEMRRDYAQANAALPFVEKFRARLEARKRQFDWQPGMTQEAAASNLIAQTVYAEILREIDTLIAVAQEMDDSSNRQTVLAVLLPRLAELGCADETLMVIQDSWDEQWRARTLGEIVSYLPEHQRIFAVIHELTLAYEIISFIIYTNIILILSHKLQHLNI